MRKIPTVASIQAYVSECYQKDAPDFLFYHNLDHTESVVAHCLDLANHYCLNENDKNNLLMAAWFHDVGHLYTIPQGHEEKSVEVMRSFINGNMPAEELAAIEEIILATKTSVQPTSLLECIIRDADSYHFGTKQFFTTDVLVRKEMELRTGLAFPFWHQHSVELLKSHRFYTSYCQQHLKAGKRENIRILEIQF
jgi:predicted metal-dependent HD superfamily phosphohydrolase